jgi:hypothetical protein
MFFFYFHLIIIEILLKVALNTITITLTLVCIWLCNRKTFEHKFLLPFLVLYNLLVGDICIEKKSAF